MFPTKFNTVLTSVVTKLLFVHAVLGVVVAELSTIVDVPIVGRVLPYAVGAAAVVSFLVKLVSRVSEVPEVVRGLEPKSAVEVGGAFIDKAVEEDDFWQTA